MMKRNHSIFCALALAGLLLPGWLCQRGNNDANPAPGTDEYNGYPDNRSQLSAAHSTLLIRK